MSRLTALKTADQSGKRRLVPVMQADGGALAVVQPSTAHAQHVEVAWRLRADDLHLKADVGENTRLTECVNEHCIGRYASGSEKTTATGR
jgi:hypothetical protein